MGLRCLLGHDFGPPEIEREREENGDEMVVTVREVKTCRRCGEERVVSENKEVTAIRSPDEVGLDDSEGAADGEATSTDSPSDAGSSPSPPDSSPGTDDASDAPTPDLPSDADDDGVILDDDAEREHGEWPDSDESAASESADRVDTAVETVSAASDEDSSTDATEHASDEGVELLDDEPDASDEGEAESPGEAAERDAAADSGEAGGHGGASGHGESGSKDGATERDASAAASPGETEPWPDHDDADEGFDADQATGGGPSDVSFGGGLTPDADRTGAADDRDHGEYVGTEGSDDDEFEDIVRVDSDARADVTEFFCPNCGLTERAGETSMRVGDICPSCHKGYIAERNA